MSSPIAIPSSSSRKRRNGIPGGHAIPSNSSPSTFYGLRCVISGHFTFNPKFPEEFKRFIKYATEHYDRREMDREYVTIRNITLIFNDDHGVQRRVVKKKMYVDVVRDRVHHYMSCIDRDEMDHGIFKPVALPKKRRDTE